MWLFWGLLIVCGSLSEVRRPSDLTYCAMSKVSWVGACRRRVSEPQQHGTGDKWALVVGRGRWTSGRGHKAVVSSLQVMEVGCRSLTARVNTNVHRRCRPAHQIAHEFIIVDSNSDFCNFSTPIMKPMSFPFFVQQ